MIINDINWGKGADEAIFLREQLQSKGLLERHSFQLKEADWKAIEMFAVWRQIGNSEIMDEIVALYVRLVPYLPRIRSMVNSDEEMIDYVERCVANRSGIGGEKGI